jgi:uncharacterized protein YceK
MKNFISLTGILVTVLLIASCKKNDSLEPASSSRVKTYTEIISFPSASEHEIGVFSVNYDSKGRLVSLISTTNPGDNFIYQYPSDSHYTLDLYDANALSIHEDFYLNSMSYVDSTFQYNDSNDTSTEKYIYNANNQLTQLIQYDYSASSGATQTDVDNYTYNSSGDVVTDSNDGGTITYTYYDLPNTLSMGTVFLPQNLHLVQTATENDYGVQATTTHTYGFDGDNRLISDTAIDSQQDTVIKEYGY